MVRKHVERDEVANAPSTRAASSCGGHTGSFPCGIVFHERRLPTRVLTAWIVPLCMFSEGMKVKGAAWRMVLPGMGSASEPDDDGERATGGGGAVGAFMMRRRW